MPEETCTRSLYLRDAVMSVSRSYLFTTASFCLGVVVAGLFIPQFWPIVRDPKNHAFILGILSRDGFYYFPLLPLIVFPFILLLEWPCYYFWNRRAKRLREEYRALVLAAADEAPASESSWPPPPRQSAKL